jgi:predicted Ser/Thr protein kinase
MIRSGRAGVFVLVVAALVLAAQAADAQPWHDRYTRGLALEERGKWASALLEFEAAAISKPAPAKHAFLPDGTFIVDYDPHYHMARCLVELNRPGLAAQQLRKSVKARVTPRDKLVALRDRIEAMRGGHAAAAPAAPAADGYLVVDSDPPRATIYVDDAARGSSPLGPLTLSPGAHAVRAEKAGFRTVKEHVTITPGDTTNLVVALVVAAPLAAVKPPPVAPITASTPAPAAAPAMAVPTAVPAAAIPTAASPPSVPTIGAPEDRKRRGATFGLAVLVALAITGAFWVLSIRRRPRTPSGAAPPPSVPDEAATRVASDATLGGYELQGVLGRGGMATTFRGRRASDGQAAAIKVPHDACLADATFVARFLREGALGEQLHHPRIVRVLGAGEDNGRPYLAMELVAGRTLKEELRIAGPLPLRRALEITRDIAEALDYAHAKGVVHRDLKPENVMILADGTVKVMDFGIARLAGQSGLTTTDIFLGTPLYAAPEMVDPKRVDRRADLYALGIVLYEMIEGTVPFTADSPYRVLEMHQHAPLPPREALARPVPPQAWSVVTRLCEKAPEARYPSAQVLLVELNRLLRDFPELEGGNVF